jgi:hypothetical protein
MGGSLAALQVGPECVGQALLAFVGPGGLFAGIFLIIPRHHGLSSTSPSHWEGFPLCERLRFGGMLP